MSASYDIALAYTRFSWSIKFIILDWSFFLINCLPQKVNSKILDTEWLHIQSESHFYQIGHLFYWLPNGYNGQSSIILKLKLIQNTSAIQDTSADPILNILYLTISKMGKRIANHTCHERGGPFPSVEGPQLAVLPHRHLHQVQGPAHQKQQQQIRDQECSCKQMHCDVSRVILYFIAFLPFLSQIP